MRLCACSIASLSGMAIVWCIIEIKLMNQRGVQVELQTEKLKRIFNHRVRENTEFHKEKGNSLCVIFVSCVALGVKITQVYGEQTSQQNFYLTTASQIIENFTKKRTNLCISFVSSVA